MPYTIKQAAEIMNVTPTTLRYYDKQGLLPFVERKESGYRVFSDTDIAMLKVIECLKKTGMSIKDIRQFSKWVLMGDDSLKERHEMFLERKRAVESQISELQETLDFINHKCWYYETALEAGTEKIHLKEQSDKLPCERNPPYGTESTFNRKDHA
jgi:DNA-binding transcriptional MerR regulator